MNRFVSVVSAIILFPNISFAQAYSVATSSPGAATLTVPGAYTILGYVVSAPAAGFAQVFDASTPPSDGVVSPALCWPLAPPPTGGNWTASSMANQFAPIPATRGLSVVYSTASDCYHKTTNVTTNAFIEIQYQ